VAIGGKYGEYKSLPQSLLLTLPAIGFIGSIFTDFNFLVQVGWIGMFEGGMSPNLQGEDWFFCYGYTGVVVRLRLQLSGPAL